jgi:hypothetical protein
MHHRCAHIRCACVVVCCASVDGEIVAATAPVQISGSADAPRRGLCRDSYCPVRIRTRSERVAVTGRAARQNRLPVIAARPPGQAGLCRNLALRKAQTCNFTRGVPTIVSGPLRGQFSKKFCQRFVTLEASRAAVSVPKSGPPRPLRALIHLVNALRMVAIKLQGGRNFGRGREGHR